MRKIRVAIDGPAGAGKSTAARMLAERVDYKYIDTCRHAKVRERMVSLQRQLARTGGIVMDGRDIGTVVIPDAELKIFLVATLESRAKRRMKDLENMGKPLPFDEVLANIKHRDKLDSTRAIAPLRKADDAIVIDNSELPIEEEIDMLVALVREREHWE